MFLRDFHTRRALPLTALLLGSAALLPACDSGAELAGEPDAFELEADAEPELIHVDNRGETPAEPGLDNAVEAIPDHVLHLDGGSTLSFFIDEAGVAMLEDVPADAGVASILDDPRFTDASPALVWYALTDAGTEIPEGLREHHGQLVQRGEVEPLSRALAGQARSLAPAPLESGSPCLNATFNAAHCSNAAYDDDQCWFNVNGELHWVVPSAERYKAGFCLQQGSARSWLSYYDAWPDPILDCATSWVTSYAWGSASHIDGTNYHATTYRNYVYWAGSNGYRRTYTLHAEGNPGAVWDLGARWTISPCGT